MKPINDKGGIVLCVVSVCVGRRKKTVKGPVQRMLLQWLQFPLLKVPLSKKERGEHRRV